MGRFTSQDSFLGRVDEPPSLHRYFYANANPVRNVDPDGHQSLAEVAARERERREALGQAAPAYTNDMGGRVVRADGPAAIPNRGPKAATLDELTPDERQWLDQEIIRLRQERTQEGPNAAVTVQEKRTALDKYREKREQLKQWAEQKAQQGADRLTHPVDDPIAEANKEQLRLATQGTNAEQAAGAQADRNIAKGFNETAVEGSGIAAREGTELGIQYAETEVGLRGVGLAVGGLRSVRRGLAGEEAVATEISVTRNAGPGRVTVPGTGPGGYRIPDFPPEVTLGSRGSIVEVKNVKDLSITPQLRDLAEHARSQGGTLEIFTNAPIPRSGELRRLIDQKVVRIIPLPGR